LGPRKRLGVTKPGAVQPSTIGVGDNGAVSDVTLSVPGYIR